MDIDDGLEIILIIRSKKREIKAANIGDRVKIPSISGLQVFGKTCSLEEAVLVIEDDRG